MKKILFLLLLLPSFANADVFQSVPFGQLNSATSKTQSNPPDSLTITQVLNTQNGAYSLSGTIKYLQYMITGNAGDNIHHYLIGFSGASCTTDVNGDLTNGSGGCTEVGYIRKDYTLTSSGKQIVTINLQDSPTVNTLSSSFNVNYSYKITIDSYDNNSTLWGSSSSTSWENGDIPTNVARGSLKDIYFNFCGTTEECEAQYTNSRIISVTLPTQATTTPSNIVHFDWDVFNDPQEGYDYTGLEIINHTNNYTVSNQYEQAINASGQSSYLATATLANGTYTVRPYIRNSTTGAYVFWDQYRTFYVVSSVYDPFPTGTATSTFYTDHLPDVFTNFSSSTDPTLVWTAGSSLVDFTIGRINQITFTFRNYFDTNDALNHGQALASSTMNMVGYVGGIKYIFGRHNNFSNFLVYGLSLLLLILIIVVTSKFIRMILLR